MAAVNPYLNFGSNCAEAFNFYKSVFGGEFQDLMRFKDAASHSSVPESEGDLIMHIALPIGQGTTLMGSDRPSVMGPVKQGNNSHISISAESEEEARRLFDGLSAGGQVTMPLQRTFWGATFGMFTDKFGVQWMINAQQSGQTQ